MTPTSVTLGVSFGITGSRVTFLTALTTSKVPARLHPKVIPPSLMFGHEMFSSSAATPSASDRMRARSTYSLQRTAADVHDHRRTALAQLGELFPDEPVDPDPLQPDRVEHARGCLDNSFGRMPFAFGEEQSFYGDSAEKREVDDVRVLDAVAEAAAGSDDGIRQFQRADLNRKVCGHY